MHTTPAVLRRFIAAVVVLATTLVCVPCAAQAAHVKRLKPWKATSTYRVTADLDGRSQPKLEPRAKVDHVRTGQWVRIQCQTTGQAAFGTTVWSKVKGLYVPDHFLKTYTDGFIPGVPRCGGAPAVQPPSIPAGPSRATLAAAVKAVTYERVYGSNYRIYKAKFPSQLIWKNNACSVPSKLMEAEVGFGPWVRGKPVKYYAGLFEKSCDRHDFGYRNYGSDAGGPTLDPSEARRLSINDRFYSNMRYQCQRIFSRKYVEAPQRGACYGAAKAFYTAVNLGGKPPFYR
jgi:hypothetical protein